MGKSFLITINDMMFGNFTGEFEADTRDQAIEEALDFYSYELDTAKEELNVVHVSEVI